MIDKRTVDSGFAWHSRTSVRIPPERFLRESYQGQKDLSSEDTVNGGEKSSQAVSATGDGRTMHGLRFLCRVLLPAGWAQKGSAIFRQTRKMQTCRRTSSQRWSKRKHNA